MGATSPLKNPVIRVKDIKNKSLLSSLSLPQTDEFDETIHLILPPKQTNEVKANPHRYKFLLQNI